MVEGDEEREERQATLPFGGVPYVRGSDTSRAAAESLLADPEQLQDLERLVLRHIAQREARGATDEELEQLTGLSHQSCSARRRSLVLHGRVRDSGNRRKNVTGRHAAVWVVGRDQGEVAGKPSALRLTKAEARWLVDHLGGDPRPAPPALRDKLLGFIEGGAPPWAAGPPAEEAPGA